MTKTKCPYCAITITHSKLGSHIFIKHKAELFNRSTPDGDKNIKKLHTYDIKKNNPFAFYLPNDYDCYWCLDCKSCIQRATIARQHLQNCRIGFVRELDNLRCEYPLEGDPQKKGVLNPQHIATIEKVVAELLGNLRYYEKKYKVEEGNIVNYESTYTKYLPSLPVNLREAYIEKQYEYLYPELEIEDEESTEPPKEQFQSEIPETPQKEQKLEEPLKETETVIEPVIPQEPVVESPPTVRVSKRRPKTVIEKPAAQPIKLEDPTLDFSKLSPWERVKKANPDLSLPELLIEAEKMGIDPPADLVKPKSKLGLINPSSFVAKREEPLRPHIVMNTKLPKQPTRDSIYNTLSPAQQKVFNMIMTDQDIKNLLTPL